MKDGVDAKAVDAQRASIDAQEPKRAVINFLRILGLGVIIVCIIYGVNAPVFGLTIALSGLFCGGVLIGIAEIIDVLQGIQFNTRQ